MKPITFKNLIRHIAFSVLLITSLSACTSQALIGDAVSVVATDKTFGDHAISLLSGKDCSMIRRERGMTYCKEDDPQLRKQPETYCYRELGKVTCYEQADLYSVRSSVEDKKTPPRKWKK